MLLSGQPFFEGTLNFKIEMSGQTAQMLSENEPSKEMTMHLKGGDYIVLLKGGRYPKTFLFVADSNYEYSMDQGNRLAYRYSAHLDINRETHQLEQERALVAQPTGESAEVNGIRCQIYELRRPDATFLYFVSDDYRIDVSQYPSPCRAKVAHLAQGLEGRIPLKTIRKEASLTVTTTLTGISARTFSQDQFRIPSAYTVKKRDYRY